MTEPLWGNRRNIPNHRRGNMQPFRNFEITHKENRLQVSAWNVIQAGSVRRLLKNSELQFEEEDWRGTDPDAGPEILFFIDNLTLLQFADLIPKLSRLAIPLQPVDGIIRYLCLYIAFNCPINGATVWEGYIT